MGLGDIFRRKIKNPNKEENEESLDMTRKASTAADELDQLGYFKYADPSIVEYLKAEVAKSLVEGHYLAGALGPEPDLKQLDPRHFNLDGEDLFEEGGIMESLKEMSSFFEKLNIKMTISDHSEEYDIEKQWLNHEITVNGKRYVEFKNFEGSGWAEAAQRFADMVNDQLELQGSDESLYLIYGGNDGRAVFLTDELYALATRHIKDMRERPLKTEEWCRVHLLQYHAIT